jgi:soluble cytochrome b562
MVAFSSLGLLSATALLRLPSLPNCPAIFWPTASASLRLYCAQLAADKRTPKDLLYAISLVKDLPQDHPLRPEIDHNIEVWSNEMLELGEASFQAGDLKQAIETAQKIPADSSAHQLVDPKIEQWQATWDKAEDIYKQAETALKDQDLRQAFRTATQLLGIGNQYWENTKYRELNDLITTTRLDSNKIDKAKGLSDQGGLTNLLAAIKLMEEIKPESRLFSRAQEMIARFGRDMLDLADAALDRRDYDQALRITSQIPSKANLQAEIRDFNMIAEAQSQAWNGTVSDLETAIVAVQRINRDRPLYGKAQQLISSWQAEIKDVTVLDRAKQIAQPGAESDLTAAIAEAQRIPFGNPLREQAEKSIQQWQRQIETAADQPYLDRAEQLASSGDLQAAIGEASRISPGRALYDQAGRRIDDWTSQMQRLQDQPQLDRARQLAEGGDLNGAIQVARQIGSGRALTQVARADIDRWSDQLQQSQDQPRLEQARQLAAQGNFQEAIRQAELIPPDRQLYDQAQAEIQTWRSQTRGTDQLAQAYSAAQVGSPAMLSAAIEIADQVGENNPTRREANRMIDQWSYQILQIAQSQADSNPTDAIAIANRIPANSAAYAEAQRAIQAWQQRR